jgi:hypothetical protein
MKRFGIRCRGLQPWQVPRDETAHDETPEVVQRGASNVHFAQIESAIDIPPESRHAEFSEITLRVTSHAYFQAIMSNPTSPVVDGLIAGMALDLDVGESAIRDAIHAEVARQAGSTTAGPTGDPDDLQAAEWTAFITPFTGADERDKFITRHVAIDTSAMGVRQAHVVDALLSSFDRIVLATRLREVRALTGFSRLDPGETVVLPDLGRGLGWLPATEVFGEGVFLALTEDRIAKWERGTAADRVAILVQRRAASFIGGRLPQVSPRLVLLHTLAHLLIRQLAFESGYASASLRERIYARDPSTGRPQAGILIYTAAGDSEGTLGGLVRQGEPERLAPSLLALLQRALWCSNDPICRDSPGQGIDGLNRGACHACALVSETSCVMNNVMLDRSLVVGATEPGVSFLESSLRLAIAGDQRAS